MASPLYATDEDVALRASADFALLCPRDQKIASGLDGSFAASDRWGLRAGSLDFGAAGVAPGQVVQLLGPSPQFRPPGEAMVAHAANGSLVTLRRKGQAPGAGQPPGPVGGLLGVEFLIVTLAPQIARAGSEFDRRFGLSAGGAAGLMDPRDVREAVVLSVLHGQYLAMSREAGGASQDPFATKALAFKAELDDLLARLVARTTRGDAAPASLFCTRLTR